MRFIVDNLPNTCRECEYCLDAAIMTQVGVPKPVNVCAIKGMIPPSCPEDEQLVLVDPDKNPMNNYCPCKTLNGNEQWIEPKEVEVTQNKTSSIILEG